MQKAKFRIQRVRIEGFRGFTSPQTVEIEGRNLFIFGANGRGKSSIVEAIRWCLFGAPSGGDIEVRNTFYESQECRVELVLEGVAGEEISVHREFRPGHDRSRQTIRDKAGSELRARDALPQLARLGHHESAQVIFAAQHAAGRQVPADISDFQTVLCFYLRLEDVPRLIASLHRFHEERTAESEKLAGLIEQVEAGYRGRLIQIETSLAAIRANPPWGDHEVPTANDTKEKVRLFALQAARLQGVEMPTKGDSAELLVQAQRWIELATTRAREDRERKRSVLKAQIASADALLFTVKQAGTDHDTLAAKRVNVDQALAAIVDEQDEGALRRRLDELERAKTEHDSRAMVAQAAKGVIEKYPSNSCPACGTVVAGPLLPAIHAQCQQPGVDVEVLSDLRRRAEQVSQLQSEAESLSMQAKDTSDELEDALTTLGELMGLGAGRVDVGGIEQHVGEFRSALEVLNQQLAGGDSARQKDLKVVKDLQQELSFHDLRDKSSALQTRLAEGMADSRQLLRDYRDLLTRLHEVMGLISSSFREALDRAIPKLDVAFTEVYTRLTEQLSYDLVRIHHDPERVGRLELRVASTGLPSQSFPANVLNGQAHKALHLVPYFVFSRLQSEIMELDLLLIDDPSESFDTSHVELLIQELAGAARHAQLIVASHEREKFAPHFDVYFHDEPYKMVVVSHFDRNMGPRIE